MALRLVLADDHAIFREGLRSLLDAQPGMQVVAEVADGFGALEAARTKKPDVVVIDVSMPGMNGLEATRRITAEAPEIKVLCLSIPTRTRHHSLEKLSPQRELLDPRLLVKHATLSLTTRVTSPTGRVSPGESSPRVTVRRTASPTQSVSTPSPPAATVTT